MAEDILIEMARDLGKVAGQVEGMSRRMDDFARGLQDITAMAERILADTERVHAELKVIDNRLNGIDDRIDGFDGRVRALEKGTGKRTGADSSSAVGGLLAFTRAWGPNMVAGGALLWGVIAAALTK